MAKFPITVRRGSCEAKIYRHDNHGYESYTLSYYLCGERKRRQFADLSEAKIEAERVATSLANGQLNSLQLTGADRDSYLHALELLQPLGIPLHAAIEEFVAARKIANGTSLIESAREFAARHGEQIRPGTIPELVEKCLLQKQQDGLSGRYLIQLCSDLRRFAQAFHTPVGTVTMAHIVEWLQSLNIGARTRNNLRTSIQTFFSFCKSHGFLPRHLPTEAEFVPKAKLPAKGIAIFTPLQMDLLIGRATPEMVPFIAIGGFAGLRSSEIQRLDWSEIQFEQKHIEVTAGKAKTRSRRLAPLSDNLSAWLFPLRRTEGPVLRHPEIWRDVTALGHELGLGWPQNVLRHSAISYRVALEQDVARVALESGNSPGVIFRDYRELTSAAEAKQWFGIFPKTSNSKT